MINSKPFDNASCSLICFITRHVAYHIQQILVLYDFLVTAKVVTHECVILVNLRHRLENEAWFYSKVTESYCAITSI